MFFHLEIHHFALQRDALEKTTIGIVDGIFNPHQPVHQNFTDRFGLTACIYTSLTRFLFSDGEVTLLVESASEVEVHISGALARFAKGGLQSHDQGR